MGQAILSPASLVAHNVLLGKKASALDSRTDPDLRDMATGWHAAARIRRAAAHIRRAAAHIRHAAARIRHAAAHIRHAASRGFAGTKPASDKIACPLGSWMDADAELDRTSFGPRWLTEPAVAEVVAKALCHGEKLRKYRLHAWVVMPNHVHIVITPEAPFSEIMRWVKWTTARRCNQLLRRRGVAFWQDESYDHWIRTGKGFDSIVAYVEWNPVAAGLVERTDQWAWSSASTRFDTTDGRHSRKTLRGKADLYGIAQTFEFPNELLLAASTGPFVAGQGSEFLVIHLIVKDLPNDFEKVMGHGYNRFLDS